MPELGKLVRDKIPEILRASGEECSVIALSPGERIDGLRNALLSTAQALRDAQSRTQMLDACVDLKETFDVFLQEMCISSEEVKYRQELKRNKCGGFTQFLCVQG